MLYSLPDDLQRGTPLAGGEGGEGTVYEVAGRPDLLLKVYKTEPTPQKRSRLDRLVAAASDAVVRHAAWPLRLVEIGGKTAVLIPRVKNSEPVHQLYDIGDRRKVFEDADWRSLVAAAEGTARACAAVHAAGFVVADMSDTNVLIDRSFGVMLIDCDSFVPQDDSVTAIGTILWLPPELADAGRMPRTPDHDNFSLARLIFLLLFLGSDPLSAPAGQDSSQTSEKVFAFSQRSPGRLPSPNELTLADVPSDIAEMFEDAFLPRPGTSAQRPTAAAWTEALTRMRRRLVRCPKIATHWHVSKLACPWCAMAVRDPDYDPFRATSPPSSATTPPNGTPASLNWAWENRRRLAAAAAVLAVLAIWLPFASSTPPASRDPPAEAVPAGPVDIGRAATTRPVDTGRAAASTAPVDTGRAASTAPVDTGRAASAGREPEEQSPALQRRVTERSPLAIPRVAAMSPAEPPAPARLSAAAQSALERQVTQFVTANVNAMNADDATTIGLFDNAYAEQVRFFGKDRDHQSILRQQAALLQRWPNRTYQLRQSTLQVRCPSAIYCTAGVTVDYMVRNSQQTRRNVWISRFAIDVSDTKFKIIAEEGQNVAP
jgi:hypothetical protein